MMKETEIGIHRQFGRILSAIFIAVLIVGVTLSRDPLIRVASALSLFTFVTVGGSLLVRSPGSLAKVGTGATWVALGAFIGMIVVTSCWGGSALNGRIDGAHYFLTEQSVKTETTRLRYFIVAVSETAVFVAWPLMFLLDAYGKRRDKRVTQGQ